MLIRCHGDRLSVSEIDQLAAANSRSFQAELRAALPSNVRQIDFDLSKTAMVDCSGISALIALRNLALQRNPELSIRLFNAPAAVRRIFKLTDAGRLFAVAPSPIP
jgi:anti-anti-sigma regulatory factor